MKANVSLTKYKDIHENMTESARRETEFIRQEKLRLDKNIMEIQK